MALPPYVTRELIAQRLPQIFTEGIPNRNYCVRELAASTVFAALYIGAIEGTGRYLGPVHVYRMTDQQAAKLNDSERSDYAINVLRRKNRVVGDRWYADYTREPIRDESLRDGLVGVGAVVQRSDLATTSSSPRYALTRPFAALFDPSLTDKAFQKAVSAFQAAHLSAGTLARVNIMRAGAKAKTSEVFVTLPNGETRQLGAGPSSILAKAVIEIFAKTFLEDPAVLWLSESGNKVAVQDNKLSKSLGLNIEPDKHLPDLILADLGPASPLIVFVELVATDGAITAKRQEAFYKLTDTAKFKREHVVFVTAFEDRNSAGFRKTMSELAWRSLAWFMSEPRCVILLRDGKKAAKLEHLISS